MNILDQIIKQKVKEVEERKRLFPIKTLEQSTYFSMRTLLMTQAIQRPDGTGIIAEFKRKSPSKGVINATVSVEETTHGYVEAGAAALSVLTDNEFFGGCSDDLLIARKFNTCPIIRKDFTIDEYQIIEAKSIGADAILLIAAVLTSKQLLDLTTFAHSFGLEVLLEVHNKEELKKSIDAGANLIGVNNRNLKTFEVSTAISRQLAPLIPDSVVKVSESGLSSPDALIELREFGYEGFLMGENFMKHAHPGKAAKEFMNELRKLTSVNR
jgi:indole-3-glycerol phosphate synthase